MTPEFRAWPKIPRWERPVAITEKIDGTNACVIVTEDGVYAQSRKRLITPEQDNFGFATWVAENANELRELGEGYHYGEWYGRGIQRGYGLEERRFALFNHDRFRDERPACCDVVPVIFRGPMSEAGAYWVDRCVDILRAQGSYLVPGFMDPEGVIVYHYAGNLSFKRLLVGDSVPKGAAA